MNLQGIQKLTLLDYPGRVACTVFTAGCNFRCPYCHNASLVESPDGNKTIGEDEFFDFLNKRKGVLDGVAITGGEPTLQPDLYDFICRIKDAGFAVKLDTNGSNPQILKRLLDAKVLDFAAMDIKNSREKYAKTIGREKYDTSKICESADMLMTGELPFEFRTTVVAGLHDEESMIGIGKWLTGNENYYLQGFVDSGDILTEGMSGIDKAGMQKLLDAVKPYIPNTQLRGV